MFPPDEMINNMAEVLETQSQLCLSDAAIDIGATEIIRNAILNQVRRWC